MDRRILDKENRVFYILVTDKITFIVDEYQCKFLVVHE